MEYQSLWPNSLITSSAAKPIDSLKAEKPSRKALITGITGQDGIYMTAFLLFEQEEFNYHIHGIVRKNSAGLPFLTSIIEYLQSFKITATKSLTLHTGDITDPLFIYQTIEQVKPDEIYNFGAQTHVQHSFFMASHTFDVNLKGLLHICQAVVQLKLSNTTKIFQASTSEMYGQIESETKPLEEGSGHEQSLDNNIFMDEKFPFNPASPYAVSKIAAYYLVKYYRNVYRLQICTAFSFNHESPLRHDQFITRKITKGLARIKHGLQDRITLGNLYAKRDWGHTKDYVRAYWLMLNQDRYDTSKSRLQESKPSSSSFEDFVVATEMTTSVKDFLKKAAILAGFQDVKYLGEGLNEQLIDNEGRILAEVSKDFIRPGEVPYLQGSYKKIKEKLNWEPRVSLDDLIKEMLDYDMKLAEIEVSNALRSKL